MKNESNVGFLGENLNKKPQFYLQGKYFDSLEDLLDYQSKWADMPLDIQEFETQMKQIIECQKTNFQVTGSNWTNRDAYKLLRLYTDWVDLPTEIGRKEYIKAINKLVPQSPISEEEKDV